MKIIALDGNPGFNAALKTYFETHYQGQQEFVPVNAQSFANSEQFVKIAPGEDGNVRDKEVFLVDSSSGSWPALNDDQNAKWLAKTAKVVTAWQSLSANRSDVVRKAALEIMFAVTGAETAGNINEGSIANALRPDTRRSVNDDLMRFLVTANALVLGSVDRLHYVMPFMPYLRQDRKAEPRTPITARMLADILQDVGNGKLRSIITSEMHADQEQGFFKGPVDNLKFAWLYAADIQETMKLHGLRKQDIIIVSPDLGGDKRTEAVADLLGMQQVVFKKKRIADQRTEDKLLIPGGGRLSIKGKVAVMIDDMIDSGNSADTPARALKEMGAAKVVFYAGHGLLTAKAPHILARDNIDQIVTTSTLQPPPYMAALVTSGKLSLINVAPFFAESMRANAHGLDGRDENGGSVSSLFSIERQRELCEKGDVRLGRHVNCFNSLSAG